VQNKQFSNGNQMLDITKLGKVNNPKGKFGKNDRILGIIMD
jgi:hypothetical protein